MATTIITKFKASGGAPAIGDLAVGELAVDHLNKKIYTKSAAAGIITLAGLDTLPEILANGNTTGGTDLAVSTGDDITFADSSKAIFGAGSDLEILSNGTDGLIRNGNATGEIRMESDDRIIFADRGFNEVFAVFNDDDDVKLYHDSNQKLATTSTGIDVTGTAVTDGVTVAGNILLTTEGNELQFNTSSTPVNKIYSDDTYTSNGLTISADNGVALKSTNNYLLLDDTGTNEMVLNVDGGERMRVTSTGIDVTGTVTTDGLTSQIATTGRSTLATFQNSASLSSGNQATIELKNGGQTAFISAESVQANTGIDLLFSSNDSSGTETNKLRIAENGDISFYEDTGTTPKFVWDASAESLTLSGTGGLTVDNSGTAISITNGDGLTQLGKFHGESTDGFVIEGKANNNLTLRTKANTAGEGIKFQDSAGDNMMFIDGTTGNVGIGTSSPQALIDLKDTTPTLRLTDDRNSTWSGNETLGNIEFFNSDASSSGTHVTGFIKNINDRSGGSVQVAGALTFGVADYDTAASEAMRIDSSGNLLVGKTVDALATAGIELRADNTAYFTKDSSTPVLVNRVNTDGDLIQFRQDNATPSVGSIGVSGGDLYIGTGDTTIRFADGDDAVIPRGTAGAVRDGAIDLGISNNRFKDLYLSGGAYLGGTVAANKLDDYEEGTWTPAFLNVTSTVTSAAGSYTKIGRVVFFSVNINLSALDNTDLSGLTISLPFTSSGNEALMTMDTSATTLIGNADKSLVLGAYTAGSAMIFTKSTGAFLYTDAQASGVFVVSGQFRTA